MKSTHRLFANYRTLPAVSMYGMPGRFYYPHTSVHGDAYGVENSRVDNIQVLGPASAHLLKIPLDKISWGMKRLTTVPVQTNTGTAYTEQTRYLTEDMIYNPASYSVGWSFDSVSKLGITSNVPSVGMVRNASYEWYGIQNITTAYQTPYILNYDDISRHLYLSSAFQYKQWVSAITYRELDSQLITTDSGGANEALHYFGLIEVTLSMTAGLSNYNSMYMHHTPGIFKALDMTFSNISSGPLMDVSRMIVKGPLGTVIQGCASDFRVTLLIHAIFHDGITSENSLSHLNIVNVADIIAVPKVNLSYWTSSVYEWAHGECLGTLEGTTQPFASYYKRRWAIDNSGTRLYPGEQTNFLTYVPHQPKMIASFSAYALNGRDDLRVLVRYVDGSSYIYTPISHTVWTRTPYCYLNSNFLVLDGATGPVAGNSISKPIVSDMLKSVGGVGDNDTFAVWSTMSARVGYYPRVDWEDGNCYSLERLQPEIPSVFGVASTETTNNGTTFQIISALLGDKIYSFVNYGVGTFASSFPRFFSMGSNSIVILSITTQDTNDSTVDVLSRVEGDGGIVLYENATPIGSTYTLSGIETVIDTAIVRPKYYVVMTFLSKREAEDSLEIAKDWKIYNSTDLTTNILKSVISMTQDKMIKFEVDLASHISANSTAISTILYLHGCDRCGVPFCLTSTTSLDARPINVGTMELKYGSDYYPIASGILGDRASGVIHTNLATFLTPSQLQIIPQAGYVTENILYSSLEFDFTDKNWTRSGQGKNVIVTQTEGATVAGTAPTMLSAPLILKSVFAKVPNMLSPYGMPPGVIAHGGFVDPQGTTRSQTSSASNGNLKGVKLTLANYGGEVVTYTLPQFVFYDNHRFVIIESATGRDIVEVDKDTDLTLNDQLREGEYYVGSADESCVFTFNFRCVPNCIDSAGKYTLFWENDTGVDASGRLSSPAISRWWLVGIPTNRSIYEFVTYQAGPYGHSYEAIPGYLGPAIQYEPVQNPPISLNSTGDHAVGIATANINEFNNIIQSEYLTSATAVKIVTQVTQAAAGTVGYDNGVVWASGVHAVPHSGYCEMDNQVFELTFNSVGLTLGVIPAGRYGLYYIVRDAAGGYTGIDLTKANLRYQKYKYIANTSGAFYTSNTNY